MDDTILVRVEVSKGTRNPYDWDEEHDADHDERNDKVVCVPIGDPAWSGLERADDLPGGLAEEIAHFFSVYGDLQGKQLRVEGWGNHDDAMQLIEDGRKRAQARVV